MTVQPETPTPEATTPAPEAPKPTEPAAAAPEAPKSDTSDGSKRSLSPEERLAELPGWARNEITQLRQSKTAAGAAAAAETAAEQARAEIAQTIGKALGLVKSDEPVDPAELTKQVTASQADARSAKVELAVFRAAAGTDADAAALLDSRAFLAKVADLDPSDSAAITAAITEMVETNPRLGKAGAPQGLKPNPAQGRSASPPATAAEQIAAAQAAGDTRTVLRLKAALAMNPQT